MMMGGRERGHHLIEKMIRHKLPLDGFIVMEDDEHEVQWSERIVDLLKAHDIPNCVGKSFRSKKLKDFISEVLPDIILVENWRTLIPDNIISKAKHVIVFHESLLPKYRGFAPLAWPIINDEQETGVSMFFISDRVDAGDIIEQKRIPIGDEDTSYDLFLKTYEAYWALIRDNLPKLIEGKLEVFPQKEEDATYACMRTPEDGHINWAHPTRSIYNHIRALAPPFLPGAYSFYDGKKIAIKKAVVPENQPVYVGRIPGRIVEIGGQYVSVLTGDGIIHIEQIWSDGEILPAPSVLTRMKIKLS